MDPRPRASSVKKGKAIDFAAMSTLTVELEESTARRLRDLAETSGRSPIEVLREALEAYSTGTSGRPPILGLGGYHSGRADVSDRAEEFLRRGARNKKMD